MKSYENQYIGGQWRPGRGGEMKNYNPYTGHLLYTYTAASREDLDDAYAAAAEAQPAWAETTPAHKQALLEKLAQAFAGLRQDIIACSIEEGGKTRSIAEREADSCVNIAKEAFRLPPMVAGTILPSNSPGRENYIYRMPKGVVGVVSPWNMPFGLAVRYIVPAIACGNAVVAKPASDTPATAFIIAQAFEQAGFPPGLFNAVAGKGSEIGDAFITHRVPAMISFTGSTGVGSHVGELAGSYFKDVALELGGNNVMMVLEDADMERAASEAITGKFMNSGQVCMAINRFIVLDAAYDAFMEAFVPLVKKLAVGDPADAKTVVGPLINAQQVAVVEDLVKDTIAAGAKVVLKGKTEGNLVYPWVLADVQNRMPTAANEVFGPVCSIIRVPNDEEAVRIANYTRYGLSGCLFTGDGLRGMRLAKRVRTGAMHINSHSISAENHVMFGGEKYSGKGRSGGQWFIDSFTTQRLISIRE